VTDTNELVTRPELQYIAKDYIQQWLALRARSTIPKQTSNVIQANRLRLLKALNDAGARILKRPCGVIAPGRCADLILLDGNPLQDVRSITRMRGVMVR
jgi:cytosine/adenosine deaminase-related metal-dependent hydrolase